MLILFYQDHEPQVGPFEVRTTQMQSGYIPKLRIHPKDPDNKVFILVSVTSHTKLRLCGWLMGIEGKRRDRWGFA